VKLRLAPYLGLLRRNSAFRNLYVAQLISFAGDWFATVALLGLVLELTGSAAAASLVIVLQTGGFALASPIAGVLADRLDRRKLMVAADFFRVPVALALLLARTPDTLWICYVALALLAMGAAVFEPTSSAALPNLVEPDDLGDANVLLGSAWGVMLAVGAGLGGIVAATLGRDAAFVLNAMSFAVSGLLIVGIKRPFQQTRAPDSADASLASHHNPLSAIRVVLRFASQSRLLSALLVSKTMFGVGTGVILMLAVFGRDVFQGGDVGIGILYAARGLGALIGPFIARATVGVTDRGIIRGIVASVFVVAVAYAAFPLSPGIWFAAALVFVAHLGGGAQWMLSTYGLQRAAPDVIRGRVFSFDYGLVTLVIAASTILAGILSEELTPSVAVWAMVALISAAGLAWAWFTRPLLRPPGPDVAADWSPDAAAGDVQRTPS
jgi:predicted MFS family arabinose efflux permease